MPRSAGRWRSKASPQTRSCRKSVLEFLVSQGVKPDLISAKGFGDADPVASNDTAQGRAQNRRVELSIPGSNCQEFGRMGRPCAAPELDVDHLTTQAPTDQASQPASRNVTPKDAWSSRVGLTINRIRNPRTPAGLCDDQERGCTG